MATYKVVQNVEAEDKILGPLTLKQLIFGIITIGFAFGAFRVATLFGSVFLAIPFLPFMIIFGVLAAPFGKNQPTEVWLAAQIHFLTKPKVRLWDQNNLKKVVHVNVPQTMQKNYTDGLSQNQVKSRLSALASTLDSHGWAVKNIASPYSAYSDDRLVNVQTVVPVPEEPNNADIFAPNNSEAREFDIMLHQADSEHKQKLKKMMQNAAQAQSVSPEQNQSNQQQNKPQSSAPPAELAPKANTPTPAPVIVKNTTQTQTDAIDKSSTYGQSNPTILDTQQTTQEEQDTINKILEQKHKQDQAPTPTYRHKVVVPDSQTPSTKEAPIISNTPPQQSKIKSQQKQTNNNDTIDDKAYVNVSNLKTSPQHKPEPKQSSDEVIINLH